MKKFKFFAISALMLFSASASVFLFDPETRAKYLEESELGIIPSEISYQDDADFLNFAPDLAKKFIEINSAIYEYFEKIIHEHYSAHKNPSLLEIAQDMFNNKEISVLLNERQLLYSEIVEKLPEDMISPFKAFCAPLVRVTIY